MTGGGPTKATRGEGDRAALDRLLGIDGMAWLVARVRRRIVSAGDEPLSGIVQRDDPTAGERAAAARLVGRTKRASSTLRIDLAVVEEVLRRGPWPAGLADAVEVLTGPVRDVRAERGREDAAWEAARDELAPTLTRFPQLAEWWEEWCAAGGLKRTTRAEAARTDVTVSPSLGAELVRRTACVLDLLPATEQPLAVIARTAVGDAHGLDATRPLGRLCAAVVRAAFSPGTHEGELSTRDVWAAAGVVRSSVASTVLCLGVPGESTDGGATMRSATATSLNAMRAARAALVLTLDQVRSGGAQPVTSEGIIHVCENPTIVEVVAARWARAAVDAVARGSTGPVLVCTSGQPSTAVVELLHRLSSHGAQLRYHGDFDWAGLRIARSLSMHVAWVPWRFTAADYRAALQHDAPSRRLTGAFTSSPWDPELADAMVEHGLAVDEEAVAQLLAADVVNGIGDECP